MSTRISLVLPAAVLAFAGALTLDLGAERTDQSPAASAASLDPAFLKAYQWRNIGPARAGRSIAASGVKGRPKEAYSGQTGGGLWKTIDAGETWLPVTDGQVHSSSVGAVAVSDTNPDLVWIGMGEQCIR
ncbi:MAG: glycosyl hydrolase, partial [Vicinamibacterales bacterium]